MTYTNLTLGELLSSNNPAIKRNATGILKQLQKKQGYKYSDFYKYKTIKEYENYIRKENKCHDVVVIGNTLYTMDNYDSDGEEISYGNLKKKKQLLIKTENRYKLGFFDAEVIEEELLSWRNDMTYLE